MKRTVAGEAASFADLEGKVAIVTGGTRGLGRATALLFSEVGVRTLLIGRQVEQGTVAEKEIRNSAFLAVDLEADDASDRILTSCLQRFGRVDILINNAAIYPKMPMGELTASGVERQFKINTITPMLLMQAVCTAMAEEGAAGSVVNVVSAAAFRPVPTQSVYGASKAALVFATKAFAAEFASKGVRVNAISPGAMDHGDGGRAAALGISEEEYAEFVKMLIARIPLGRKAASREVAASALFLCSSLASVVTGHILHCDGGETI